MRSIDAGNEALGAGAVVGIGAAERASENAFLGAGAKVAADDDEDERGPHGAVGTQNAEPSARRFNAA